MKLGPMGLDMGLMCDPKAHFGAAPLRLHKSPLFAENSPLCCIDLSGQRSIVQVIIEGICLSFTSAEIWSVI